MSTPVDLPVPASNLPAVVPPRGGVVAFLSSTARRADWVLPRQLRVAAALGNVDLDLTRAQIGAGTFEIQTIAVLGNIDIIIPAGVRVECNGEPLLGVFDVKRGSGAAPAADAPLLIITGAAILGCIDVKIAGTLTMPSDSDDDEDDDWM
jgi:hypothetical protein